MLCDRCKKNEATVHIKEFINGKCTNFHLCSQCASEVENAGGLPGIGFNLAEVLLNVNKIAEHMPHDEHQGNAEKNSSMICPVCNWSLDDLKKYDGRLGCPACYKTFGQLIKKAVSQMQRGGIHLGKRPRGINADSPAVKKCELESLQKELKKLIAGEEYEAAALCRDRINALRAEINNLNAGEDK